MARAVATDSSSPQKRVCASDDESGLCGHKLRRYDTVGVLFDASELPNPNSKLWTCLRCVLHMEWSADDLYRQRIALSRYVQSMLAFGESIEEPMWGLVLKADIVYNVKKEFAIYKRSLQVLHERNMVGNSQDSIVSVVTQAAGQVYDLLWCDNAILQGFLQLRGGAFYAAVCSDRAGRCAIAHECGEISRHAFVAAAISLFEKHDRSEDETGPCNSSSSLG